MAEETVHSLATPKVFVPDRGKSRIKDSAARKSFPNSTKNILPQYRTALFGSYHEGYNKSKTRKSTGDPKSPNSRQNVLPHYLRASTGSCHDFCKYGTKHEFVGKERHHPTTPKRITAYKPNKQNFVGAISPAEKKKAYLVKHKQFHVQTCSQDSPEVIKKEVLSSKRVEVSSKVKSLNGKKMTENEKNINVAAKRAVSLNAKPAAAKPFFLETSLALSGRRDGDAKDGKRSGTLKDGTKKTQEAPTPLRPRPFVSRVVSVYARKYRSLGLTLPLQDQNRIKKVQPKQSDKDRVSEKTLHVVGLGTESQNVEPVQNGSIIESSLSPPLPQPNLQGLDNSEVQEKTLHVVETEINEPIVESFECVDVTQLPLSPSLPSPELSSSQNSQVDGNQEKYNQEEFEYTSSEGGDRISEKDDPKESEYNSSEGGECIYEKDDQEESEYASSEGDGFISENELLVNPDEVECSGEPTISLRKHGTGGSEEKNHPPVKLKFRRGKVVDLQTENNAPKKLRFRQGRVWESKQDSEGDTGRRILKERRIDEGKKSINSSSEKVVLRHQDAQGKKDAQCLFNNVIEETATKLAQSRQSKVKALVGAFETVISLQESKPSTQA